MCPLVLNPPSHLPPYPIPLGCPSAPALNAVSCIKLGLAIYSLKSSHPRFLLQSPKVYSLYLCLFCYLVYRVIITIFLNSIYMR